MATNSATRGGPLVPAPEYTVHEKQREVAESDARFRVLCWGRRAGKNITANIDLIERSRAPWTTQWGGDDPANYEVWFIGRSYDQARKHGFETFVSAIPNAWIDGDPKRTEPYRVDLVNGVTVEFRTYDHPETLQGAGVDHITIDEAAYMPKSVWENDLEPMLMDTMGSCMMISKPIGRGVFHESYERGRSDDFPDWESFHATSADNPFIAEDPTDKKAQVPDRVYKQEYLAEFVDESGGVFSDLDDRLFTLEVSIDDVPSEPPYSHGWDLARHQDWTVGTVLDNEGRLVHFERVQGETWPQIQRRIESAADEYEGVVAVDASRDNKLVADLESESGLTVEPVKFSQQKKTTLVENLAAAIEGEELAAPLIEQLRHELSIFEYDVTSAGNVRYHAPDGFHDDAVDSLAMANWVRENAETDESEPFMVTRRY